MGISTLKIRIDILSINSRDSIHSIEHVLFDIAVEHISSNWIKY